jgi:hypothetical protein
MLWRDFLMPLRFSPALDIGIRIDIAGGVFSWLVWR